jgi:hypothetical protein
LARGPLWQLPDGKDAGYAADGTLAFRAVAGFENTAAQAGEITGVVLGGPRYASEKEGEAALGLAGEKVLSPR